MVIKRFPDPRLASPDGIVAIGGDLEPESLDLAYRQGIFPWPMTDWPLTWFCPPRRAILASESLHIPRSLARSQKKGGFSFSFDQAFDQVIDFCKNVPRPDQPGTWITDEIVAAYRHYHRLGRAHSVEVWREGKLVGGLYGVDAGGTFAGESMFHLVSDASKLAVLHLLAHCQSRGLTWIDIQMLTPHMEAMGAQEITRNRFLKLLAKTQALELKLF